MNFFNRLIILTIGFIVLSTSLVSALSCHYTGFPENNPKITGPSITSSNIMEALDGDTVELTGHLNYLLETVPERLGKYCRQEFIHPIFVDSNHEFILLRNLSSFKSEILKCVEPPIPFGEMNDTMHMRRPLNWEHQIQQCEVTLTGKFAYEENPLFQMEGVRRTWLPNTSPMDNTYLLYLDVKDVTILKQTLLRKALND